MGEVTLCLDRWIDREVAVKTLRNWNEGSTGAAAERFLREARVQAQLEHPSVVPVYECGIRPDGREYFSMQRIRGATLADIIHGRAELRGKSGRTEEGERRRLLEAFTRLCLAVDYAHSRGVIHRDLKPSNVMLGDFGEIYLLDWGVAKVIGSVERMVASRTSVATAGAETVETAPGTWLGTVGYMAPEQFHDGSVDARVDVYALGAILFEVLTKHRLHEGTQPTDNVQSTLDGVEARPTARFRDLGVPAEFDAILARATAIDPVSGHGSAREPCEEVERFLDGDRNHVLRRELAQRHADEARQSLDRIAMVGADVEKRHVEALRDVGRALALDPNNSCAVSVLAQLLLHEPQELPADVLALEERSAGLLRMRAMRTLLYRILIWTIFIPLTAWMGYRSMSVATVVVGTLTIAAGWLFLTRNRREDGVSVVVSAMLLASVICLGSSAIFGPFMLVPAVVAVNSFFFILHLPRRWHWWVVVAGIVAVHLPFALGLLGVIPAAYQFVEGRIVIEPTTVAYPALSSSIVLVLAHLAIVITPALVAMRVQHALASAERRILL